jgi:hypothetical protein
VVKTKKRGTSAMPDQLLREERKNISLVFGSICHVMNSTCIHLRAKGLNTYMYRRGRIYKESPREIQ